MIYKLIFSLLLLLSAEHTILAKNTSMNDVKYNAMMIMSVQVRAFNQDSPVKPDTPKTVEVGDTCPICKGTGKQSTDGVVQLNCIWCDGDGVVDNGDEILNSPDVTPVEPIDNPDITPPSRKRKILDPLQKPANLQSLYVDTYSFRMNNRQWYYVQAPNKFICPTTGEIYYPPQNWFKYENYRWKKCHGSWCEYPTIKKTKVSRATLFPGQEVDVAEARAIIEFDETDYSSPVDVVEKALAALNPKPNEIFLDPGCGDGRTVIMAAMKYGCKCIGIEQDAERIEVAKQKAEEAGVLDKITFINANIDEIKFPHFDVAYAYLFPEDLKEIRNKLLGGDRFASFAHQVPNLPMYNNGDFYIWDRDKAFSWYEGRAYTGRICSRNNCSMCASIVNGIKEQKSHRN